MGNNSVERKRKKKGRPSLLDLQKRSLRLQKQFEQQNQQEFEIKPNPNPNPNPYLRFPNSSAGRSISRRNPNQAAEADDEDDDEDSNGKRREKKLKLVHTITNSANSASDGDGDREKGERNNSSKRTELHQGDPSDLGPTTPLPDEQLLVFILDRLQKKDTYGVFSEPVDPDELPDYHEIIQHPMDFGTVRKKLSSGVYANLEQFEKDVFLISSNAMQYNLPDTIYYRQARAIHDLAKKNFENLRQETDDSEPETKITPKRGRPPSKNIKQVSGRPSADRAASDFSSSATLANVREGIPSLNHAHDLSRKGPALDGRVTGDVSARTPYNLRHTQPISWAVLDKLELNEEYSGYGHKRNSTKYGKKFSSTDENQRNTYNQLEPSSCMSEPSVLAAFDGQKKQLLPIGVHIEHAYARSLARFAANLGPVGWAIAAKKIERVLSPGTKFGRGWVGDSEKPVTRSQLPPPSTPTPHFPSEPKFSPSPEPSSNITAIDESRLLRNPIVSTASTSNRCPDSLDVSKVQILTATNIQPITPQLHQSPGTQSFVNGYTTLGFSKPTGPFLSDALMTHARVLNMVSNRSSKQALTSHFDLQRAKLLGNSVVHSTGLSPETLPRSTKQETLPPDLNVVPSNLI